MEYVEIDGRRDGLEPALEYQANWPSTIVSQDFSEMLVLSIQGNQMRFDFMKARYLLSDTSIFGAR
jgi:hypothetical protein